MGDRHVTLKGQIVTAIRLKLNISNTTEMLLLAAITNYYEQPHSVHCPPGSMLKQYCEEYDLLS